MAETASIEKTLLAEIETQKQQLAGVEPRLRAMRLGAMRAFADAGLPTRHDEAWRWTDLRALRDARSGVAPSSARIGEVSGPFAAFDAIRLQFLNGVFRPDLSSLSGLPAGARVASLRAMLQRQPALAGRLGSAGRSPLFALNTALLNDGAFIRVDDNVQLARPLHLIFCNTDASQVRNLIMLGDGAAATLLESHYGADGADYFVNHVSDVWLGERAVFAHYRDQAESAGALHFYYLNAALAKRSHYEGFTLTRGARLSRYEAHVEMAGQNAECSLNGAYMLNAGQIADTTTLIDHAAPGGVSRQLFRGVLDGRSRGIFQGRISVRKTAQQTDARQQIKAMLLSPGAEQNSKPELEILADDVKCAHGASIGQIDETALFYLRSRGIALPRARAMLIGGFLDDAIAQISGSDALSREPLQQAMRAEIDNWLGQLVAVDDD